MMAFTYFKPDMAYKDIYVITPEKLLSMGIKGVVFDIDNTIAPYEIESPTEKMLAFFDSLKRVGIKMAFVSNNKDIRVMKFNENLGLFYVCKAGKPSPKGVRRCIEHFGLSNDEVIAVGDQIFTDCIAAHRAGIKFIMVKPIKDKETLFFKIKRTFERPFVKNLRWKTKRSALAGLGRKKEGRRKFKILRKHRTEKEL